MGASAGLPVPLGGRRDNSNDPLSRKPSQEGFYGGSIGAQSGRNVLLFRDPGFTPHDHAGFRRCDSQFDSVRAGIQDQDLRIAGYEAFAGAPPHDQHGE